MYMIGVDMERVFGLKFCPWQFRVGDGGNFQQLHFHELTTKLSQHLLAKVNNRNTRTGVKYVQS